MRELVKDGELAINLILSFDMLTDDFTKALPTEPFKRH